MIGGYDAETFFRPHLSFNIALQLRRGDAISNSNTDLIANFNANFNTQPVTDGAVLFAGL